MGREAYAKCETQGRAPSHRMKPVASSSECRKRPSRVEAQSSFFHCSGSPRSWLPSPPPSKPPSSLVSTATWKHPEGFGCVLLPLPLLPLPQNASASRALLSTFHL